MSENKEPIETSPPVVLVDETLPNPLILNRTSPKRSLAADLLGPNTSVPASRHQLLKASIKDISETLSDFNSCISSFEASDIDASPISRLELKKRKRKMSPRQQEKQKKANLKISPEKLGKSN